MSTPKMIRSGVANDTGRLKPTLQHCLEAALSITDTMVDEMLDRLALIVDPERVTPLPLELEQIDPDLILQLIDEADTVKASWQRHLRQFFFHGEGHDADLSSTVRFDDLRLMDDEHIDASIEYAMVEQALAKPSMDLLPRLNALVSGLMGWMTVQPELNPLKPSAYARALRAVMVEQVPDTEQRRMLFVPVAGILGDSLRQVYRELIQWLLAHGVEPVESPAQLTGSDGAPSNAVGRTLLTLGRLRQLLAGDLNESANGDGVFVHTVPLSLTGLEDMDLIEPLLKRLRERPAATEGRKAVAELPVVSGRNLGRLLGQEVVRLMLDNLTQDERLLPAIRQQIGQLEPALIRLSQSDPRFFSDRQHPARQLLESVTQRSLAYASQNEDGFADLLRSVRGAVQSLADVDASEEVFSRLLKRLRRRWEEDDAAKNQRQIEAARALMHAEQRQVLAERLAGEFQQRLQDKDVPEFVQRFLVGPWAQAVAESRLTPAVATTEEGESIEGVVDELIWSVQPALIRRDVDRLARLVPRLLAQMRHGLQAIDYPLEPTGLFFDALVSLHEKAFDTPTLQAPPAGPSGDPLPSQQDEETFWIAGREAAEAGFVDAGTGPMGLEGLSVVELDLSTGAWVDLKVQGEWVRAQLTWTSPRGGLFMFISASGLAHSMTRRTLDRLLGSDSIRIVSRGGVVEGALDAVAQQAMLNTQRPDALDRP
ncbi:DUF1631 family protein [Hydrogenophaga sp.]|uniref:DUF1631 family protein n=1 Tax=Hydrogenophaga sp. TaxID=1904254 RepID=UPI0035ADCD97